MSSSGYGDNSEYNINITEYDDKEASLEGTFSGKLGTISTALGLESVYITITDGEFYVKK